MSVCRRCQGASGRNNGGAHKVEELELQNLAFSAKPTCRLMGKPMNWEMKDLLNSTNELIEDGFSLANHCHADPLRVVSKALHMISLGTLWSCIRDLYLSR